MNDFLKHIFFYQSDRPLLFTQMYFWVFLLIVYTGYCAVYDRKNLRNAYLFLVSIYFYYKTSGFYFLLLLFTTVFDYSNGLLIARTSSKSGRKLLMWLSILVNLSILGYFKYTYFFAGIFSSMLHHSITPVNIFSQFTNTFFGTDFDITRIVLPVGISFYTFQSLSYIIELTKKRVDVIKNFMDYGFFVSFFPQLVSGPITRSSVFIPQMKQPFHLTAEDFNRAVLLIITGLIKKIVIADYIGFNFIDRVFDMPSSYTGFENLMAVYGYGIQIYCDFSGYTDIAIGVALLMGFRLPVNFNSPYKAENITDFWKRWHISLTNWFRDFLFMPLALAVSSRLKKEKYFFFRTDFLIYLFAGMLTFLLTGLWHGADFRFIIWGGLHGILLVGHRFWTINIRKRLKKSKKQVFGRFLSIFITFNIISLTWLVFRAKDMTEVGQVLTRIATAFRWDLIPQIIFFYRFVFLIILIAYIIHWLPQNLKDSFTGFFFRLPAFLKIILIVLAVFLMYQVKTAGIQPFIYFQF